MQYKRLKKRWKSAVALMLSAALAVPVWAETDSDTQSASQTERYNIEETQSKNEESLVLTEEIDSCPDLSQQEDSIEAQEELAVLEEAQVYRAEENPETEAEFSYIEVEALPQEQELSQEEDVLEQEHFSIEDTTQQETDAGEPTAFAAEAVQAVSTSRAASGWKRENGIWYYYNTDGSRQKGWVQSGGKYYYLNSATGAMLSSELLTIGGKTYFFKANGSMAAAQWVRVDGIWYYASAEGDFVKGWLQENGDYYYLDPVTGQMQAKTVITEGGKSYILNGSGRMVLGNWGKDLQGNWYYAGKDGVLLSEWQRVDGKWYYMDKTTYIMKKSVILQSGAKRFLISKSGAMVQNDWVSIEGYWYFANEDGTIKTGWLRWREHWYWLGTDGCMQTGWLEVSKQKYYTNAKGEIQTGLQEVDGKSYLFKSGGQMTVGWGKDTQGDWYYAGKDGILFKEKWYKEGAKTYYLGADGRMYTGWQKIGENSYHFSTNGVMSCNTWIPSEDKTTQRWVDSDGVMATGWLQLQNKFYYLDSDGYMQRGWVDYNNNRYYLQEDGVMATGWQKLNKRTYYFKDWGGMAKKWLRIEGEYYYFGDDGEMQTGWITDAGKTYYLLENGAMATGWKKFDDQWYYFKTWGAMAVGWVNIDGTYYYCNAEGVQQTGWITENGKKYYLDDSGRMLVGWHEVDDYERYFNKWGQMQVNTVVDGKRLDEYGRYIPPAVQAGKKTVKNLLRTAMQPIGECLYVWGGGHDAYKGGDALRIGVNPKWKSFYNKQGASYDYTKHRYEYGNGLDCSGFVGWAIYNVMNTKNDYVGGGTTTTSTVFPSFLKNKGWGTYKNTTEVKFKTGDVVSMDGHVWLVVGQCDDGSVVIIHATPPVVQISGTVTPDGKTNSQAVALADKYMKQYYPDTVKKYNLSIGSKAYLYGTGLNGVNRFQWNTASGVVKDPEGYLKMKPEQILNDLYTGK